MEGNYVAKYSRRFNKAKVYRDKSKIRPPKKLTMRDLDEEEIGNPLDTYNFYSKVSR